MSGTVVSFFFLSNNFNVSLSILLCFVFFLAIPPSLLDLSSPTKEWNLDPL